MGTLQVGVLSKDSKDDNDDEDDTGFLTSSPKAHNDELDIKAPVLETVKPASMRSVFKRIESDGLEEDYVNPWDEW